MPRRRADGPSLAVAAALAVARRAEQHGLQNATGMEWTYVLLSWNCNAIERGGRGPGTTRGSGALASQG